MAEHEEITLTAEDEAALDRAWASLEDGSVLAEDHGPPPHPGLVFDTHAHRWKNPGHPGPVDASHPSTPDAAAHFADGLESWLPRDDVHGRPGLIARAKDAAVTAAAKVYLAMVRATPAIQKVLGALPSLMDDPSDLSRLGYAPVFGSDTSTRIAGGDPVRHATDGAFSAHMASAIASHVLSRALVWAKSQILSRALSESGVSEADVLEFAGWLHEVMAALNESLHLPEPPAVEELAGLVREKLKGTSE